MEKASEDFQKLIAAPTQREFFRTVSNILQKSYGIEVKENDKVSAINFSVCFRTS